MKEQLSLGKWSESEISCILERTSMIRDPGERIRVISECFLNVKYKEASLIGSSIDQEVFVIDLEGVDCFTFIEYVEAMRRSETFADFRESLKCVRYRSGEILFEKRNHFFTDWKAFNADFIVDVTESIGKGKTKSVSKRLNEREDGTVFLPGVPGRAREVIYIRTIHYNDEVASGLKTGDYAGIYAKTEGLDVSHVGIIIKKQGAIFMRHASSLQKHRKVMDEDFACYIRHTPGFIVFRARDE